MTMNINTDLVKNKEFASAIKSSALKHSQEYKVLATLRYLFPARFNTMITGESPDIQDCVNEIGIEVTAAVKENDMKVSRIFSELHQGKPMDKEKRKEKIKLSEYSFVPINDEKAAISTTGTSDGEKCIFQECIRKKTKKLQQYRANFKSIGLAIIFPEIPTSHAENNLSEWTYEIFKKSDTLFDFVYVISHRFCIYYDTQSNVSEKHLLTCEENELLSKIARMTAEGELSLTDKEWL